MAAERDVVFKGRFVTDADSLRGLKDMIQAAQSARAEINSILTIPVGGAGAGMSSGMAKTSGGSVLAASQGGAGGTATSTQSITALSREMVTARSHSHSLVQSVSHLNHTLHSTMRGVMQLSRGFAEIGILGHQSAEGMLRSLVKVNAAFHMIHGAMRLVMVGMHAISGTSAGSHGAASSSAMQQGVGSQGFGGATVGGHGGGHGGGPVARASGSAYDAALRAIAGGASLANIAQTNRHPMVLGLLQRAMGDTSARHPDWNYLEKSGWMEHLGQQAPAVPTDTRNPVIMNALKSGAGMMALRGLASTKVGTGVIAGIKGIASSATAGTVATGASVASLIAGLGFLGAEKAGLIGLGDWSPTPHTLVRGQPTHFDHLPTSQRMLGSFQQTLGGAGDWVRRRYVGALNTVGLGKFSKYVGLGDTYNVMEAEHIAELMEQRRDEGAISADFDRQRATAETGGWRQAMAGRREMASQLGDVEYRRRMAGQMGRENRVFRVGMAESRAGYEVGVLRSNEYDLYRNPARLGQLLNRQTSLSLQRGDADIEAKQAEFGARRASAMTRMEEVRDQRLDANRRLAATYDDQAGQGGLVNPNVSLENRRQIEQEIKSLQEQELALVKEAGAINHESAQFKNKTLKEQLQTLEEQKRTTEDIVRGEQVKQRGVLAGLGGMDPGEAQRALLLAERLQQAETLEAGLDDAMGDAERGQMQSDIDSMRGGIHYSDLDTIAAVNPQLAEREKIRRGQAAAAGHEDVLFGESNAVIAAAQQAQERIQAEIGVRQEMQVDVAMADEAAETKLATSIVARVHELLATVIENVKTEVEMQLRDINKGHDAAQAQRREAIKGGH